MRKTSAEIDHAILDVAAGIFAVHGFAHTSVQQIADAVGYSKPGLLHRFGSKDALYQAVLTEVAQTVQEVTGHAAAHHGRPDQVRQVFSIVAKKALARPGVVQMMLRAFVVDRREPELLDLRTAGYRFMESLDVPQGTPVERLRVVLALRLIGTAATMQGNPVFADMHVERERLVPLLVTLAEGVLRDP